jgi:tyrosine-protein kinase Etk/Wzc
MKLHVDRNFDQKQENILNQILTLFLPYWPVFIFSIFFGLGVGLLYISFTNPKYEASATLIVKDETKGNDDSKFMESLNLINTKKIVENEIEVLQSRKLMNEVVKSLHLYAPIFEDGNFNSNSAFLTSPILVISKTPHQIKKVSKIEFSYENSKITLAGKKYPKNEWLETPYGVLMFVENKNSQTSKENQKLFFSLIPINQVSYNLLNKLTVSVSGKLSTLIYLKFIDEVPQRAEDILNELIIQYTYSSIEDKNALAKNTLLFLENRLNSVGKELMDIEEKILQYKSTNDAIDISSKGQLFLANVSANDQKLGEINMQLAALDQIENLITNNYGSSGIIPSTLGISDPTLSNLLERLYTVELEHQKLKTTVAENNPLVVSLKDQINKIRPIIIENIQGQRRILTANKGNIANANFSYNSLINSIPLKEKELIEISREQLIKKDIYSFLLQKKEESEMSNASTVSDIKIVDQAQSSIEEIGPNNLIIYLFCMVASMGFVSLIIIIREGLSSTVLYRNDINKNISLPIIGEIAYNSGENTIVVEKNKRTFIGEGFRELRITLLRLGIDSSHKKILITSSISGEGKSFVAANLSTTLALTSKRVVLVDMDLNRPSLSKLLGINPKIGVTQFLNGQCNIEDIIFKTQINENLFFIPSGELPENPSELLAEGSVANLFSYLESAFDLIMIDTAPVVPVTDAFILSPLCNATLFIVRHNYTPKKILKRFEENPLNILQNPAIIFNGVKERGFIKNQFGYGYGHTYEYNYIATSSK